MDSIAVLGVGESARGAPLGTSTYYRGGVAGFGVLRRIRFRRQKAAAELLRRMRVAWCMRSVVNAKRGVSVVKEVGGDRCHFRGLDVCGSVWFCPVCAARISESRRAELALAVARYRSAGGGVYLVTLTFSHKRADDLGSIVDGLLGAWRRMRTGRAWRDRRAEWGVVGQVRALEVTWSEFNGWHPHLHALVFARAGLSVEELAGQVTRMWLRALAAEGLDASPEHAVRVSETGSEVDEYVAKWGHEPEHRLWSGVDEVAKGTSKSAERDGRSPHYTPFQLLDWYASAADRRPVRLFREYAEVFAGRQQLVWSDGLRSLMGLGVEESDEVIAESEAEDVEVVCVVASDRWGAVCWFGDRSRVLELAESEGALAVAAYVEDVWVRYGGRHEAWVAEAQRCARVVG